MKNRTYERGEKAKGECPTCKRAFRGALTEVDFDKELCRCGRPFNGTAYRRLKQWICNRKIKIEDYHEAADVANRMRMDEGIMVNPYKCRFCGAYHVGKG